MKVALVTGAGSGIGRAVAIRLAKDGYKLVLAGRRMEKLQETQQHIDTQSLCIPTDVTDHICVAKLFEQTLSTFGRLDLLFNNAGSGTPRTLSLEDIDPDQWRRVVDTNLSGSFFCIQQALVSF